MIGHAHADASRSGRYRGVECGRGLEKQRERPGPEARREARAAGRESTELLRNLRHVRGDERQRSIARTPLGRKDTRHGVRAERIDGKAVEGVGRQSDDSPALERSGGLLEERRVGTQGIDAEPFQK